MIPAGYKWQVITDEGCFTAASGKGIDIFEAVRQGQVRRLVFFCERSNLPYVAIDVQEGMELIFCRIMMRDKSLSEPPYPMRYYQIIGYRERGRTFINEVDLDRGTVRMFTCHQS